MKPTGDPDKHTIEQGLSALSLLRQFAEEHDHSVVALKSDDWKSSFFIMRGEFHKNSVKLLKTGDKIYMAKMWDELNLVNYWEATVI